jgi:hypothetical protein
VVLSIWSTVSDETELENTKTFIETVSKLMLDKKPPQTSNSITNLKDSFVLLEITKTELIKIIQSMKNKKSAGLDGISPYLLKKMYTSRCYNW